MTRELALPKTSPRDAAFAILDGIEAGQEDIVPDPFAVDFGRQFGSSPKVLGTADRRDDRCDAIGFRGVSERPSPEQLKEFGASVPQLVPWKRFDKAEEVAPVIAFLASKPARYVTVALYTMGGEWKRESAAARDVDRTWDGRERR